MQRFEDECAVVEPLHATHDVSRLVVRLGEDEVGRNDPHHCDHQERRNKQGHCSRSMIVPHNG